MRRLALCGSMLIVAGCGGEAPGVDPPVATSDSATSESTGPTRVSDMQVSGTLSVDGLLYDDDTRLCLTDGGFSDIKSGAQVVISDRDGSTLAIGELDFGTMVGEAPAAPCVFDFHVPGVPRGEGFYGIEVANRGVVQFTEDDVADGVQLEIG